MKTTATETWLRLQGTTSTLLQLHYTRHVKHNLHSNVHTRVHGYDFNFLGVSKVTNIKSWDQVAHFHQLKIQSTAFAHLMIKSQKKLGD